MKEEDIVKLWNTISSAESYLAETRRAMKWGDWGEAWSAAFSALCQTKYAADQLQKFAVWDADRKRGWEPLAAIERARKEQT